MENEPQNQTEVQDEKEVDDVEVADEEAGDELDLENEEVGEQDDEGDGDGGQDDADLLDHGEYATGLVNPEESEHEGPDDGDGEVLLPVDPGEIAHVAEAEWKHVAEEIGHVEGGQRDGQIGEIKKEREMPGTANHAANLRLGLYRWRRFFAPFPHDRSGCRHPARRPQR